MRKNIYLLFAILTVVGLTIISLKETNELPLVFVSFSDKLFHIIAYMLPTIAWCKYLTLLNLKIKNNKILTVIAVFLIIYGIIIEVLQSKLTTTRIFELNDILANTIGVVFGLIIFKITFKYKLKSN